MLPGDRLITAFITPQRPGDKFAEWLPHLTIMPWFRLALPSQKLASLLSQQLADVEQFTITVGSEDYFGNHKLVNLLQQSLPLNKVEARVRNFLKDQGAWLVDETTKQKRDFRPHITVQKTGRLHEGDVFMCDRLFIVSQRGDYKEIEAETIL